MNETDPNWIAAAIAVVGGIAIGSVLARLVRGALSRERRPEPIREAAGAIAANAPRSASEWWVPSPRISSG